MTDWQVERLDRTNLPPEDAERLARLLVHVWPERKDLETRRREHSAPVPAGPNPRQQPCVFVIRAEGEIVAEARAFPRTVRTPEGERVVLALAGVACHADYRGRGLGRRVVQAALSLVDDGDYDLALFQTSHEVCPFYEKLGARTVDNRFANSRADDPDARPWWDDVVMIYPAGGHWIEGTVDLLGPAW